jgi:hypothetical protein
MVAAVAATLHSHPLSRRHRELADHGRRDRPLTRAFEHGLRALGVGLGLIASCLEAGDAVFQLQVTQIGHAQLNGVVQPLEA